MKTRPFVFVVFLAALCLAAGTADAQRLTPSPEAIKEVLAQEPSAQVRYTELQARAEKAMTRSPDPVAKLFIEGRLTKDPDNIRSREALQDMGRMDALALVATLDQREDLAKKGRAYVAAWFDTYEPTGNPINETNLEPLIRSYDLLRDTFPEQERERHDASLRKLVEVVLKKTDPVNNWGSHRLKVAALSAYALRDPDLIADVETKVRRFLGVNLNPDGSTLDFHERDALHYHVYSLVPLLTIAQTARRHGVDFYSYETPKGASLPKSVAFLVPYATGEKTHAEFVNSKMGFDRTRSEAGQTTFKTGRPFDPERSFPALQMAAAFDSSVEPLARKHSPNPSEEFPTWQFVINAADAGSLAAKSQSN